MAHLIIIDRNEDTGIWKADLTEYYKYLPWNTPRGTIEAKSYPELQKKMSEFIEQVNKNYTHE